MHEAGIQAGFERQSVEANGFKLLTMRATSRADAQYLHVYLEGDGVPWRKRSIIAADPTSEQVMMLDLMALDARDSLYIGRPCYNGTAREPGCDNRLWTSARYSVTVVDTMTLALREFLQQHDYQYIRLIGHSGGGALAMLMAERFGQVTDVITVAGNLDTTAWTNHHGYTPLYSSLNPSDRPPLARAVRQWHWLGERDKVIPPSLVTSFTSIQENALVRSVPLYSHNCCWADIWPQILDGVEFQRSMGLPGTAVSAPGVDGSGVDNKRWQVTP